MYYICNYTYNYKGTDGEDYSDFDCSSIVRANSEDEAIEKVANDITEQVINVISFLGIFVIVRAALLLVKLVSKIINKLPILKQVNDLGGAICGFIEGAILVYTIFAVISIAAPTLKDTTIIKQINDSALGKQMYTNNLITNKVYNIK